jgi:hypothetical protein
MSAPIFTIKDMGSRTLTKSLDAIMATQDFRIDNMVEGLTVLSGINTSRKINTGVLTRVIPGVGFAVDNPIQPSILWKQIWLHLGDCSCSICTEHLPVIQREGLPDALALRRTDSGADYGFDGHPDCDLWERNGMDPLYVALNIHYSVYQSDDVVTPWNRSRLRRCLEYGRNTPEVEAGGAYLRAWQRQWDELGEQTEEERRMVIANQLADEAVAERRREMFARSRFHESSLSIREALEGFRPGGRAAFLEPLSPLVSPRERECPGAPKRESILVVGKGYATGLAECLEGRLNAASAEESLPEMCPPLDRHDADALGSVPAAEEMPPLPPSVVRMRNVADADADEDEDADDESETGHVVTNTTLTYTQVLNMPVTVSVPLKYVVGGLALAAAYMWLVVLLLTLKK